MNKNTRKSVLMLGLLLAVPAFALSQISFWGFSVYAADSTSTTADQAAADAEKARQDALKKQQNKLEDKIEEAQKEKAKLEQNLTQIHSQVVSTQQQINKSKNVIEQTAQTLSEKEQTIAQLSDTLDLQKELLKNFLQQAYYIQNQPVLNVVLAEGDFVDLFSGADHYASLDDKIVEAMADIRNTQSQIEQDKAALNETREQHEQIVADKVDQQQGLLADQSDVQGDIQDKEATISELQQKLAELESDLNVLTGKSFNAKDIKEAVEYASGKTGVPKGVLYGFLKMETNLGANTGQCTYEQVEKVAVARYKKYGSKYKSSIALLYKREDLFYDLVDKLGYGKNKKVSCSPSGYIGQGGAMGIPQFMSDVWIGYSSRIASNTGHATPDPWDITDGVMAMAIKLKGAGATSSSPAVIKKASINYLGTFYANYYNGIVYWSKNYSKLFN